MMPGTDGLLHISEMAHTRVERVTDVMKEGDIVEVKVLSVDRDGKIRLTRRELLPFPEGEEGVRAKERLAASREAGAPPRGGDRGGRGGGDVVDVADRRADRDAASSTRRRAGRTSALHQRRVNTT